MLNLELKMEAEAGPGFPAQFDDTSRDEIKYSLDTILIRKECQRRAAEHCPRPGIVSIFVDEL